MRGVEQAGFCYDRQARLSSAWAGSRSAVRCDWAYSPALGRFLQVDPIGTDGGLNLYAYVRNDPVNLLDPIGLETQYSINVGGTTALFLGLGGNFSVGISVPDRWSDFGGYQLFGTAQGNGMIGAGLYLCT